jgi:CheY-like chemotaxis protein
MGSASRGPVLVVDDHPISRLLFERVLEPEGVDVIAAGSIAEAQRLLAVTAPAVVVLDLQLPDGHGLDLARRLKADPSTARCAIVACTASDDEDEEPRALAAGCAALVTKPIDTHSFASLVCSLIPAAIGT